MPDEDRSAANVRAGAAADPRRLRAAEAVTLRPALRLPLRNGR